MNEGPVSTGELRIIHRSKLIERLVGSGRHVRRGDVRPGASHDVHVIARSDLLSTCEKCLSEPQRQGLTFLAEFSGAEVEQSAPVSMRPGSTEGRAVQGRFVVGITGLHWGCRDHFYPGSGDNGMRGCRAKIGHGPDFGRNPCTVALPGREISTEEQVEVDEGSRRGVCIMGIEGLSGTAGSSTQF